MAAVQRLESTREDGMCDGHGEHGTASASAETSGLRSEALEALGRARFDDRSAGRIMDAQEAGRSCIVLVAGRKRLACMGVFLKAAWLVLRRGRVALVEEVDGWRAL